MVGDRLVTDMVFGNKNNMVTVKVKPFNIHESQFFQISRYGKFHY